MPAKPITIVQAYEAEVTPEWILRCLKSVQAWALIHGYTYHFSPEFWRYVPAWFIARCGSEKGPMTDIARMYMMREQFDRGAQFVVWVDADVIVFDEMNFIIPDNVDFFGIREVSVMLSKNSETIIGSPSVNGAVLGARKGSKFFETYMLAIEAVVRNYPARRLPRTIAGPQLLTDLATRHDILCLTSVGLLTPAILNEIALGKTTLPALCAQTFGHRIAAANLCHFFLDLVPADSVKAFDALMNKAIDELINSRGEVVNQHLYAIG